MNVIKKLYNFLKERWDVKSVWQMVVILFIFSITGLAALYVRRFVFDFLGFNSDTALWLRAVTWLFTVVPSYQVLFLFFGFILGQFNFVWNFEKQTFKKIKRIIGF